MRSITINRDASHAIDHRSWLLLLCSLAIASVGKAAPPIDPLPVPDYSFDLASCAVDGGIVDAGDILHLSFPDPIVLVWRTMLGLHSEVDDLDALSAGNTAVPAGETFTLLFSVDAQTVALAPPDPTPIDLHVPYNVSNQVALGHAAGDQFMSLLLFARTGSVGGHSANNVLTRNNYDEGGTDFSAQPPTSAGEPPLDDSLDVVDAMARLDRMGEFAVDVYFSVTSSSPSLDTLPSYGNPSGADIYFNENPPVWAPNGLYAAHSELQLDEADDIDAMIVFDINENGYYDGTDQVLFSLAPGSPSLATIPGASAEGAAADVFVVSAGQSPALFAAAADLGLGAPQDNINALGFTFCGDALFCAAQHGIRCPDGDVDRDGVVGVTDLGQLLGNYGVANGATYEDGDIHPDGGDGVVNICDLGELLAHYGDTCD